MKEENDEQIKLIEAETSQTIKDLKMAHDRNIAKLTKDMRENSERLTDQLKAELAEVRGKYELLKAKDEGEGDNKGSPDGNVAAVAGTDNSAL